MLNRLVIFAVALLLLVDHSFAQATGGEPQWRSPDAKEAARAPARPSAQPVSARRSETNVLPNNHGQVCPGVMALLLLYWSLRHQDRLLLLSRNPIRLQQRQRQICKGAIPFWKLTVST